MSKETFDFSEALRRMKEGKKVRRKTKQWFLYEINDECLIRNYCKLDYKYKCKYTYKYTYK